MDATSAAVSGLNRRRWLQVWNASGVILMTIFRSITRATIPCLLSPSRASIPEMGE